MITDSAEYTALYHNNLRDNVMYRHVTYIMSRIYGRNYLEETET